VQFVGFGDDSGGTILSTTASHSGNTEFESGPRYRLSWLEIYRGLPHLFKI